ncbi:MAG: lipoprotein-releasing system permease protein [Mariniblastus sp.]|jgi:lipoprotein-releasing system permease protein
MYKLLLSWRYLKTRFIALASIVSVTLGVATLIVVNSVMAGFVDQMQSRLHGILSDVEISAQLLSDIKYPERHIDVIKQTIGDDLEQLTCVVRTPALLSFDFRGNQWTQQVMLLGIDDETFGQVTDFEPYLTNEANRSSVSFELKDTGYDERFEGEAGWAYRRQKIANKRRIEQATLEYQRSYETAAAAYLESPQNQVAQVGFSQDTGNPTPNQEEFQFLPLPDQVPDINELFKPSNTPETSGSPVAGQLVDANGFAIDPESESDEPKIYKLSPTDPHAQFRPELTDEDLFDPMRSHHTGIILGMAISERKMQTPDGELKSIYMVKPGDDANIMLTTIGNSPSPVIENCTVVDFYSSNMHEYDSNFAFVPLSALQKLRGMVDPLSGEGSVSTIQIKLKEGADLNAVRDKLIAQFPPEYTNYDIRTWQDAQRPLLSAVKMELTILNILLFLIIAVAGFGILATFYMIVVEKTKDIGILKALGAPSRGVMSIFLGYGMSLGTVGTGVGIVIGILFVKYINEIADLVAIVSGQEVFDPEIYMFTEIPTMINPMTVVWVGIGAIAIAVLASVLPALRAARLHPVEALRYE